MKAGTKPGAIPIPKPTLDIPKEVSKQLTPLVKEAQALRITTPEQCKRASQLHTNLSRLRRFVEGVFTKADNSLKKAAAEIKADRADLAKDARKVLDPIEQAEDRVEMAINAFNDQMERERREKLRKEQERIDREAKAKAEKEAKALREEAKTWPKEAGALLEEQAAAIEAEPPREVAVVPAPDLLDEDSHYRVTWHAEVDAPRLFLKHLASEGDDRLVQRAAAACVPLLNQQAAKEKDKMAVPGVRVFSTRQLISR